MSSGASNPVAGRYGAPPRETTARGTPPGPLPTGEVTPRANAVASAASSAFPPSRRSSTPASAARGSAVIMPSDATASVRVKSHSLRSATINRVPGRPRRSTAGWGALAHDQRGGGGRSPDFCTLRCLPMDVADLLAFKTIPDVQLSPDGHRVAFVVSEIDAERDEYRSAIWVLAADGSRPLRFTRGPKRDSAPRWSPDGEHLAFLSDREDEKPQLYVMPAAGDR